MAGSSDGSRVPAMFTEATRGKTADYQTPGGRTSFAEGGYYTGHLQGAQNSAESLHGNSSHINYVHNSLGKKDR